MDPKSSAKVCQVEEILGMLENRLKRRGNKADVRAQQKKLSIKSKKM